jgi:hypothetical protein
MTKNKFRHGERVRLICKDPTSAWPVGTIATVQGSPSCDLVNIVNEQGRLNIINCKYLELLSKRKPPIKVDPKDIVVEEVEESRWNPYPFKEKSFYEQSV